MPLPAMHALHPIPPSHVEVASSGKGQLRNHHRVEEAGAVDVAPHNAPAASCSWRLEYVLTADCPAARTQPRQRPPAHVIVFWRVLDFPCSSSTGHCSRISKDTADWLGVITFTARRDRLEEAREGLGLLR